MRVISNRLPDIERQVEQAVKDVLVMEVAEDIAKGAADRSRRRTGFLKDSWKAEEDGPGKAAAYSDAATAHIHEYGAAGAGISAQPMATPAVEKVRSSLDVKTSRTVKRAAR